jgi:hypothetical protein
MRLNGNQTSVNDLTLTAASDLTLTGNTTASQGNIALTATADNLTLTGQIEATAAGVTLTAGKAIDLKGSNATEERVKSGSSTSMIAGTTLTNSGQWIAGSSLTATATTGAMSLIGDLTSGTTLALTTSNGAIELTGNTDSGDNQTITAATDLTVTGDLVSEGELQLTTASGAMTLTGNLTADNHLLLQAANGLIANGNWQITQAAGNLRAATAAGDLTLTGSITLAGGHITLHADDALTINGSATITTQGSGTIDLTAANQAVTQASGGKIESEDGNMRIAAATDVALQSLTTKANVSLIAERGDLTVGGTAIKAEELRIKVGGNIGLSSDPLVVEVSRLSAHAGGAITLLRSGGDLAVGAVDVTVQRVAADGSSSPFTDAEQLGLHAEGGAITLNVTNGNLTLEEGAVADSATIDLTVARSITLADQRQVAAARAVTLSAADGAITMGDASRIANRGSEAITLSASNNIALAEVIGESGTLKVDAGGAIIDVMANRVINLTTSGTIDLRAVHGIGGFGSEEISITAGQLTAINTTSGHVVIAESDSMTIAPEAIRNSAEGGWVVLYSRSGVIGPGSVTSLDEEPVYLLTGLSAYSKQALTVVQWGRANLEGWAHTLNSGSAATEAQAEVEADSLTVTSREVMMNDQQQLMAQLLTSGAAQQQLLGRGDGLLGDPLLPFSAGISALVVSSREAASEATPQRSAPSAAIEESPHATEDVVAGPDSDDPQRRGFWQRMVDRLLGRQPEAWSNADLTPDSDGSEHQSNPNSNSTNAKAV